MKKKVCIVSGGLLPVPAVCGGAVETLAACIAEENAKTGDFNLQIITINDKGLAGIHLKHARLLPVAIPGMVRLLDKLCYFYVAKIKKSWKANFYRKYITQKYYAEKLKKILSENDYDLIVVENNMSLLSSVYKAIGQERYEKQCVYHMHSVLIDNLKMTEYLLKCRKIIAVSRCVVDTVKETYPAFCNTDVSVLTNGIDYSQFDFALNQSKETLKKEYGIPQGKYVYLYCGRISEEKGVRELVQAYVRMHNKDMVLVFAGASYTGSNTMSPYEKELRLYIDKEKPVVIFLGYIDYEKIAEVYRLADCLIIPSLAVEAGPLTSLEGAAMGLQVIAPAYGAVKEYLGEFALYFQNQYDLVQKMEHVYLNSKEIHSKQFPKEYFGSVAYYERFKNEIEGLL